MYEGVVLDVEPIGKRPGTRYRVELYIAPGDHRDALVYMVWNEAYGELHLYCYYHKSAGCQCVAAVEQVRKDAHIDSDRKDD